MGRDILEGEHERGRVGVRTCIETGPMRPREVDELGSRGAIVCDFALGDFTPKAKINIYIIDD